MESLLGGPFGSCTTFATTGEYAGVVRVVVFFAMSARMDPSALCRAPGVSAK